MKRFQFFTALLFLVIFNGFSQSSDADLNHAENTPLYFGNPSDAVKDLSEKGNYLLEKDQFVVSYNSYTLGPNWVAWHLSSSDLGEAGRSDKFTADNELPDSWYKVRKTDYQFNAYGFDRGHICPSADRTSTEDDNKQTFLMTNMLPQAPDCNRIVWKALEDYERKLALQNNELYIFAGGFGSGGVGNRGWFNQIILDGDDEEGNPLTINVPEFCWKIILVLPEGDDDLNRVTQDTQVIAVFIPNQQGCQEGGSWEQYLCSINYIEQLTQMDFFELLPDDLEEKLEE